MKNGNEPINATLTYYKTSGKPNGHLLGLTKREYFAGLAMHGLCVNKITSEIKQGQCVDIAEMSILIADELLKQLKQ